MASHEIDKPQAKFEFVTSLGGPISRRRCELQESTNKSHAARVSHARRKKALERRQWASLGVTYEEVKRRKSMQPESYGCTPPQVFAGNSDPFSSTALAVTPHVNLILTFVRDAVFPAIYGTLYFRSCSADASACIDLNRPSSIISSQGALRAWQQQADSLSDEGMAFASLAPWCDLVPQFLGSLPKKWPILNGLEMRARSVKLLREKLVATEGSLRYNRPALLHIFWLFRAELFARNFEAAAVHAKMLRSIVEDAFAHGTIDIQILIQFLFVDVDAAVMNMRRTIFDVDDWFLKVLDRPWTMIKSMFLPPKSETVIISPTIEAEPLLSAVIEIRYHLSFHHRRFGAGDCYDKSPSDILFGMITSRSFVDLGRLVNLYLRLTSCEEDVLSSHSRGHRYTQGCLALTVLFVIRSIAHTAFIQNVDIRDASATLMSHLKPLISKTLTICTDEELTVYSQAHLWTLYIIALYDRRMQISSDAEMNPSSPNPNNSEASKTLAQQARKEGVFTWSEMREVEAKFIQTDLLQPSGESWFEETIDGNIRLASSQDSGYASSGGNLTWDLNVFDGQFALT